MANPDHLEILGGGAPEWNSWRRAHPRLRPDLRRARLPEANLRGCDLRRADLHGASLLGANLSGTDLREADLSGCDLRFCVWNRARLQGAKLRGADGAEDWMLEAAARQSSRLRPPSIRALQAGAILTALALAWALAGAGFPESLRKPEPSPLIDLAAAMSQAGLSEWAVEGVAISGGLMRLRLSADEMTEEAYLATLQAACTALDGRPLAHEVSRIEILQRDGDAGWAFEEAGRCGQVLRAPRERLALTVAASSRPIRAKPDPGDAR